MTEYAITAIGRDRPGIVAALSGALLELGGNIEDSRMTILCGHFAVMLMTSIPDEVAAEAVASRLGNLREQLGLEAISVEDVGALPPGRPVASHVVSVYGADHPGIVHAVSSVLAAHDVNIVDLETRVAGDERAIYAMVIEVVVPAGTSAALERSLREVAARERVEITLRELEVESL